MIDEKQDDDGGSAFPLPYAVGPNDDLYPAYPGMTLRDWFAAQALGLGFDWTNVHETGGYAEAAQVAYEVADAMLAARKP